MLGRCRYVALGCLLGPSCAQTFVPLVRPAKVGSPSAFDTVRRRLVMVDRDGATWELDGGNLLARTLESGATQPSPRVSHAMCYDEAQRRVLMFGGASVALSISGMVFNDETWAYDGSRWTQLTGGAAPAARLGPALTWDATRNRAVMWGGLSASLSSLSDTWEHDGSTWLQRAPATSPSTGGGSMVFDRQRGVAVLVTQTSPSNPAQTWEWNGTNWTLRSTLNNAGVDGTQAMVFDATRNRTVLAGTDNRIHEWDGTSWSSSATLPQPFLRVSAASWFDPGCGCVALAGGLDRTTFKDRADLWGWNGQALTQLQSDAAPQGDGGALFADPPRGRVVHFGGYDNGIYSDATWALANGIWSAVPTPTRPGARMGAAATYDLLRGESLLFGGEDAVGVLGDTWSLGGAGWVARSTTGPGPRAATAMAADVVRGVIVLFGGAGPGFLSDTWEWNGTLWTQRATTIRPTPRSGSAMAFHPLLGKVVLFGGIELFGITTDTWTWDGSQWTQLFPATRPPALSAMTMSSDLTGNRCILVGGDQAVINDPRRQVWTFDGTNWQHALDESAISGFRTPCCSGARLDTVVCSNGPTPAAAFELTFSPGRVATIGAGCGTPASTLATRSRPQAGANNGLELVANPGRAVLFALDLASGSTPLGGGCTFWLSPGFLGLFQISDAAGFASQALSLPASGFGLDLSAQAAVLEPLSSNGLVLTRGLRLTLGD